jgi:hypothetical protein
VQSNDTENEDDGQRHDDDGVDLEARRLVSVQPWVSGLACSAQQQSQRRAACGMQPIRRLVAHGLLTQHGARAATGTGGSCAAGPLV